MSQTFYLRNTVGPDYHHHAIDMKTKCPTDLFYDFETWGTFLFDICLNWTLFYSYFNASKEFTLFFINRVENLYRSPAPWSRRNQEYVVAVPHRKRPLHSRPPHQLEWQQWLLAGTVFRARILGSNSHGIWIRIPPLPSVVYWIESRLAAQCWNCRQHEGRVAPKELKLNINM